MPAKLLATVLLVMVTAPLPALPMPPPRPVTPVAAWLSLIDGPGDGQDGPWNVCRPVMRVEPDAAALVDAGVAADDAVGVMTTCPSRPSRRRRRRRRRGCC